MSDLEKDFNDLDELQIDGDSDGFEDLQDFVDLDDLTGISAEDVFADMEALGDISDLGDLSDINELSDLSDLPDVDDLSDLDELPELDELSELASDDILGSAESEVDASSLLAGLMEDSALEDVVEDSFPEIDSMDIDTTEIIPEDMETVELAEPELDVADLFQTVEPEELEEPAISEADIPLPDDLALSDDLMSDLEEALETVDAISDFGEPEISLDAVAEPMAAEPVDAEESLDDMLDGLLDDLDANGSLEIEQPESLEEEMKQDIPEEEGGLDDLLDLLTSGDSQEEAQEDVVGLEDMFDEEAQADLIPEAVEEEPKKPGLMKRLFGNVVTDEIAEQELAAREAEKEAEELRAEEAAKAKEEAAEAKALKAEEKAAKKAAKAEEKALKKAAKAEEKAAKKAEKEARKAEEEAELEVVGKLNKVGVSIIVVLTVLFLTAEISGTQIFSYASTLNQAKDYFEMQKYTQAYQEILGTDIKEKDQETYDKIVTVMKVQRSLNSYANYDSMKYYPDALNALLRGMEKYDENIETGRNLEVEKDMDSCREQILMILEEEFGLSESEAYDILAMEKEEYTEKVVEIGMNSK